MDAPPAVLLVTWSLLTATAHAHGAMQWPPSWFDANGSTGWLPGGFILGSFYFTNETYIPGTATLDPLLRTFPRSPTAPTTPWSSPGTAPLASPCGINGGNPTGCPPGVRPPPGEPRQECPGGGFGWGADALDVSWPDAVTTRWAAGSAVEVAWGIKANHGGGYSYRLCRRGGSDGGSEGSSDGGLSEECFQRTPLAFVGDTQWVQYGGRQQRVAFRANRTSTGTTPRGSEWTKNPIPACAGLDGGQWEPRGDTCDPPAADGPQFPPPAAGLNGTQLAGFGESALTSPPFTPAFGWSIVDQLRVPDLPAGDYVLSFRWDAEQTPQVWSTCSNVRVEQQSVEES